MRGFKGLDFELKAAYDDVTMKLSLEEIQQVITSKVKDPAISRDILESLNKIVEDKQEEKEETSIPKAKNEYAVVVLDETGVLKDKLNTAYVIQYKAGDDVASSLSKITKAAKEQNTKMKKFIKNPLKSMTDVFANLKRKYLKPENILIKTQEPVRILFTNNKL